MPHYFTVKESHNMARFMPGDEFKIDRDMYPEYFYKKIGADCEFVLVYPRGAKV